MNIVFSSFFTPFLLSFLILNSCLHHHALATHSHGGVVVASSRRAAFEIIIGGGGDDGDGNTDGDGYYIPSPAPGAGDCPDPPPPPPPPEPEHCPTEPPLPPPTPSPPPPPPPKLSPPPPKLSPPPPPKLSPPPPVRPPSQFINEKLKNAYFVIQNLKRLITSDPKGITKTWVGFNPCVYKGLECAVEPKSKDLALASIQFNEYGFGGPKLSLVGFIDKLPEVSIFHANSNNFSGTVPSGIANLPYLFEFDISNNKYECEFPQEVLGAKELTFLDLRFNSFSGKVPPGVFLLDLDVLFINNNNFYQNLPDNLGSTPALFLTLANNKFTGSIPSSIGRASNTLIEVLFLNNQLSGCLPEEIGQLKKLTVFDVGCNFLTGPIPQSFGCLIKMEIMNLAKNRFYGAVPESVCKLPNLANLTLSRNYFTQVGPECRKLIKKKILDVRANCILDLTDQRPAGDCDKFYSKNPGRQQCPMSNKIPCNIPYTSETSARFEPGTYSPRSYGALAPARL